MNSDRITASGAKNMRGYLTSSFQAWEKGFPVLIATTEHGNSSSGIEEFIPAIWQPNFALGRDSFGVIPLSRFGKIEST